MQYFLLAVLSVSLTLLFVICLRKFFANPLKKLLRYLVPHAIRINYAAMMRSKLILLLVSCLVFILIITVSIIAYPSSTSFSVTNTKNQQSRPTVKLPQNVVILGYHRIVNAGETQFRFDVTEKQFRQQLDFLKRSNYKAISIESYKKAIENKNQILDKSVIITFDDGYKNDEALKILREYQVPATFFVVTKEFNAPFSRFKKLTLQDIKDIDADPLFSVYSHGETHVNLTNITPEKLYIELYDSRKFLEDNLGGTRDIIAYPYGAYNSKIRSVVSRYYSLGFGVIGNYKDILNQPRYLIGYSSTPDIVTFRKRLNSILLKKRNLAM
jgi:peptidoglycan/xylan/chitin deacetylase (PgdA/CDA1 family)